MHTVVVGILNFLAVFCSLLRINPGFKGIELHVGECNMKIVTNTILGRLIYNFLFVTLRFYAFYVQLW